MKKKGRKPKYYKFFTYKYLLIIIFFIFFLDFTYTKFLFREKKNIGIKHEVFHHHMLSNYYNLEGGGNVQNYPVAKIYTNSLGFRDFGNRKIDLKKKNRIIFIGDSFTFGSLLNFEFTVPGLAYNYFNDKGIEVLNAGVPSYSPSIYYNKIKFFIEQGLEFSHLVVFIDISDIEDEAIIYKNDENTQYIKTINQSILKEKENKEKKLKFKIENFFQKNIIIIYTSFKFIKNKIQSMFIFSHKEFIENVVSKNYKRDKWTIDEDIQQEYNLGIQRSIHYMTLLKDTLDKHNIKLTIVVYPWFTQIYHHDLDSIQVKIWEEFSKENNSQFINLFPVFINDENKNLDIYKKILLDFIPYDVHWNQNGSKKIFENFIKDFKY